MSPCHNHVPAICDHTWERRADLDDTRVLRFACSKCGVLGCRKLSPREPVRAYRDGRTQMPEFEADIDHSTTRDQQMFFRHHGVMRESRAKKAWNDMLRGRA